MNETGAGSHGISHHLGSSRANFAPGLETLLGCVKARDVSALGEIRRTTSGKLFALALRIVGNRADAEEVVSDVFIRVWLHACRFDKGRGSAQGWLVTLCRNASIDHVRAKSARGVSIGLDEEPATASSPEIELEQAQLHLAVLRALEGLTDRQREVVMRFFYLEWTHQEIALAAKLPLGTVKSHLRRSIKRLYEELQPALAGRNRAASGALGL